MFYRGYGYYYYQHQKNLLAAANTFRRTRAAALIGMETANPGLWVFARLGGLIGAVIIGVALVASFGPHA